MINIHRRRKIGLLIVASFLGFIMGCSDMSESDFDAAIWQSQKGSLERDNPRAGMIAALEKYHIRVGMKREQVRDLLGEPDKTLDHADIYDIGASPVGVDLETYRITYSEGMVYEFQVVRH